MENTNLNEIPDNVLVSLNSLLALRYSSGKTFHKTYKKSGGLMSGNFSSPFRGRGIDFSEVRLYQPGDDIRNMDWRVTARTGKPHTKLFTEERERPVLFVFDSGSSMQFGTKVAFKTVTAAKTVALLAWSAIAHGDRVGGLLFDGENHEEVKPAGGKRGILKFLKKLVDWNKQSFINRSETQATNFHDVVARLRRTAKPGSLVYIVSDFINLDRNSQLHLGQIAQHCDIVLIQIFDAIEKNPPPPGSYMITDGKTFENLSMDSSDMRKAFKNEFTHRQENIQKFCTRHGIHYLSLSTTDNVQQVVRDELTHKILKTL